MSWVLQYSGCCLALNHYVPGWIIPPCTFFYKDNAHQQICFGKASRSLQSNLGPIGYHCELHQQSQSFRVLLSWCTAISPLCTGPRAFLQCGGLVMQHVIWPTVYLSVANLHCFKYICWSLSNSEKLNSCKLLKNQCLDRVESWETYATSVRKSRRNSNAACDLLGLFWQC